MGKATRWLKGLFGMRSATNEPDSSKDRQRWGIGGSGAGICHNPATIPPNITPAEAAWLKSYFPQANNTDETERNKHAVAVAAATAAAADAAVAAAQAAVEVVRLTSRGINRNNNNNNLNLNRAAAIIQANFRGYLARKALRALKGLVKIQALVRGYLVRKQATATLHSMQALIRAQATVRSKRASKSDPAHYNSEARCIAPASPGQSRRLSASFEARTLTPPIEQDTPKVVEVDLGQPGSRSARRGTRSYSELGEEPGSYQAQFHFQSPSHLAPGCLSMPDHRHRCCHHLHCGEWECGPATTQTTPRFSGCGSQGEWGREQLVYYQYPNYMSKTTSYKAKVRSVSAPKQRPESNRKRMSLSEMMEGRNSLSGVRMQRSCSHVQQQPFKNAVMGKFGKSSNW